MTSQDTAKGAWNITTEEICVVWCDASSLATGAAIDSEEEIVDMSWLRPKYDGTHINIKQFDTLLKGLNMVLKWQRRITSIRCDSVYVCK